MATIKSFKADILSNSPICQNNWWRADAWNVSCETLYGGQFTLSIQVMKAKLSWYTAPLRHHYSLLRNLPPLRYFFVSHQCWIGKKSSFFHSLLCCWCSTNDLAHLVRRGRFLKNVFLLWLLIQRLLKQQCTPQTLHRTICVFVTC